MTKQEAVYQKVEAARAKNPDTPVSQLLEKLGVPVSAYYKERRLRVKAKPRGKYRQLKAEALPPAIPSSDRLMVIVGSPEQVRSVIAGVFE